MNNITSKEIEEIVFRSKLEGYAGHFRVLGGGELNDTFLLALRTSSVVLRIAKHADQDTLTREARALKAMSFDWVPKLIFFDENSKILGKRYIVESYIPGLAARRLSLKQFENLGLLLARVHNIQSGNKVGTIWSSLLSECETFGDETYILEHPDQALKALAHKAKTYFSERESWMVSVRESLIHGDATPSNVLVSGDHVALIDWELSKYKDPMAEFSTMYYEDMEYNRGKWRVHITQEEKDFLFAGYQRGGGKIDEDRIRMWINFDKFGSAVFLYWRIHNSGRLASDDQMIQYRRDLNNLIASLERSLG